MQKPPLKLIVQRLFFLLVFLFIFSSIFGIFNVGSVNALSCSKTTYTTRGPFTGVASSQASACTNARAQANSDYQCITSSCTNQPLGCLWLVSQITHIPTYVCTCNTTCTKCEPSTQTWSCPTTQCNSSSGCTYFYGGVSCPTTVGSCTYGSSQANSATCGSSCSGGGSNPTPPPVTGPCTGNWVGGVCSGDKLYQCNGNGGSNGSQTCTYGCQVNPGNEDTCKPPPSGGCTDANCNGPTTYACSGCGASATCSQWTYACRPTSAPVADRTCTNGSHAGVPLSNCGSSCGDACPSTCPTTAPTGISPANGTTFAVGTTQVTIDWNSVPGAGWYNIRVTDGVGDVYDSRNSCTTNIPYVCINNNGGATNFTFAVRNGRTYSWTIIPNNTGCGGGPTGGGSFNVANPSVVNGVCSATHYNCNAGSLPWPGVEYSDQWQWWCYGSNGGSNSPLCSEMKAICNSGISCGECSISSPSCGTGTQTCTYTTHASGTCTQVSAPSQSCTIACSTGSSCISNACVCDEPATPDNLLPNGSIPAGPRNITWDAVSGVTTYALRIDDYTVNDWNGLCSGAQNPGDVCDNNVTGTSYSFNFIAGHSYHIWVHAINATCEVYSNPGEGYVDVYTNVVGQVYIDYNGNGAREINGQGGWTGPTEPGSTGVEVTLSNGQNDTTDSGGNYIISNVLPNTYTESIVIPNEYTLKYPIPYPPTVYAYSPNITQNFGIQPPPPVCNPNSLVANPSTVYVGGGNSTLTVGSVGSCVPGGGAPGNVTYTWPPVSPGTVVNVNSNTTTYTPPVAGSTYTETVVSPSVQVCNPGAANVASACTNLGTSITVEPVFTISGNVFVDANKNLLKDPGEPNYSPITITSTGGSVTYPSTGGFQVSLPQGTYTVSYTPPSDSEFRMTIPTGTPPQFIVTVGDPCSTIDLGDGSCDPNGNINNLNFGITKSIPWCQFAGGGDIGGDGGLSCDCADNNSCVVIDDSFPPPSPTPTPPTCVTPETPCYACSGTTCTVSCASSCSTSCDASCGGPSSTPITTPPLSGDFNDFIPDSGTIDPSCGGAAGAYASVPGNTSTTPGLIFTGNGSSYFGQGSASLNNWLVGGTNYPTSFGPVIQGGVVKTSFAYLQSIAKQAGITACTGGSTSNCIINLASVSGCAVGTGNVCNLPSNLPHGIYIANGDLTLGNGTPGSFYKFPTSSNYIILVTGNLTIRTKLLVPNGSTALFSASGDIIVDLNVGQANYKTSCTDSGGLSSGCDIEGIFSADRNFVIDGRKDCTIEPDIKLNVAGSIVTNAALNGGTFVNRRDLCENNLYCPVFTIQSRPDFILNAPSFIKKTNYTWKELAP